MTGQERRDRYEQLELFAQQVCAAGARWMSASRVDPAEAALQSAIADLAALLNSGGDPDETEHTSVEVTLDLLYDAAATLHDDRWRAALLAHLMPHLTDAQRRDVVSQVQQMSDNARSRLIPALAARHLDTEHVDALYASVLAIETRDELITAVAALLPHLAPQQRAVAVPKALQKLLEDPTSILQLFSALVRNLTTEERATALGLLTLAPSERTTAMTWVAAYLAPDQRNDALDCVLSSRDGNAVAVNFATLAPHLDADQLDRALAAVAGLRNAGHRARALTGLIPYLPAARRAVAVADAVTAVLAAGVKDSISNIALPDLLPHLTSEHIQMVLDVVPARQGHVHRDWHLEVLAPHLNPAQLQQALDLAASATDPAGRYFSLAMIIPHLEPDDHEAAVELALSALRSHHRWANLDPRLAAVMTPQQRDTTLGIAARRTDFADIVTGLAAHLDPVQLDRALAAGLAATDEKQRTTILVALAPHLDHNRLDTALSALEAISEPDARADALRLVAAQLPADTRPAAVGAALRAAIEIADPDDRALALTELADLVTPGDRPTVLARAYTAAMAVEEEFYRLLRLAGLIPACLTAAPTAPTMPTRTN
ncbi:hypothetical protein [Dactylosporangium sp. NPDC048998]|uniref:hypothetical protein n=1 Tax=Dactylosporangium sp. NPDC048998 TaxID=3363976 RepID=UPI00371DCEFB